MKIIKVVLLVFGLLLPSAVANAQTVATGGLTLAPLRSEPSAAPGTSTSGTLTLTNKSDQPMTIHLSAEKFSVVDEQYDYSFDAESDTAKWVTFTRDDVVLDPHKTDKVSYIIGVPLTAEPGGRYISLFATTDARGNDVGAKSQQRIASLVYLSVIGKVSRTGGLVSLNQPWLTGGQDTWTMELRNAGTTHYRSRFGVEVQTVWGSSVGSYTADALVLPASIRALEGILPAPQWPGLYKAVYTIGLGDTSAAHKTILFLYIPLWSVGAVIILSFMGATIFYYVRSLRKKH